MLELASSDDKKNSTFSQSPDQVVLVPLGSKTQTEFLKRSNFRKAAER
jgi:hypothetical protein